MICRVTKTFPHLLRRPSYKYVSRRPIQNPKQEPSLHQSKSYRIFRSYSPKRKTLPFPLQTNVRSLGLGMRRPQVLPVLWQQHQFGKPCLKQRGGALGGLKTCSTSRHICQCTTSSAILFPVNIGFLQIPLSSTVCIITALLATLAGFVFCCFLKNVIIGAKCKIASSLVNVLFTRDTKLF